MDGKVSVREGSIFARYAWHSGKNVEKEMSMGNNLKPCPHCGSSAELYAGDVPGRDYVSCASLDCSVCGPFGNNAEDAVRKWNALPRRHEITPNAVDCAGCPGPTDGFWGAADWLLCRDGKWRPVEPGTFPLADGTPQRVGRLRGYGNAIVAPQAAAFIAAFMDAEMEQGNRNVDERK